MRTKDKLTIKDLEKYGLKLPEKDTCSCTRCKLHNKTLDEIGNIDIDEAFKKWAEKNGWFKKDNVIEGGLQALGMVRREDMELDVDKVAKLIMKKAVQTHCEIGSDNLSTWKCTPNDLAKAIAEAFKKGEI